ncbi:MAG: hypothetical protein HN478_04275 [Rhodospirillaceae bacterium]|nr:hypothetical protein [Rhodospirillaceae bacterium]MBT4489066.1 hypothetical protein [Rhodospirillaceae bacterium]MBT5192385.1 hypothetical protein [Rhodospirillaceae bacterium]MBT6428816.1 hypothetical protein [Rhodospirillaceae bacterium]MBT7758961.1 hypothetical protein [Rhodospirillaceae bacterium]
MGRAACESPRAAPATANDMEKTPIDISDLSSILLGGLLTINRHHGFGLLPIDRQIGIWEQAYLLGLS